MRPANSRQAISPKAKGSRQTEAARTERGRRGAAYDALQLMIGGAPIDPISLIALERRLDTTIKTPRRGQDRPGHGTRRFPPPDAHLSIS